jgi:hypothetical protein
MRYRLSSWLVIGLSVIIVLVSIIVALVQSGA